MPPRARLANLEVLDHEGGLLIRDLASQAEHSLHPLTAFVWKHADGQATVAELATRATAALGAEIGEPDVWAAIDVLTGAQLLEGRIAPPAATQRVGRRDLLRNLAAGSVAASALGAIAATAEAAAPKAQGAAESAKKVAAEAQQKQHAAKQQEHLQKVAEREDERKQAAETKAKHHEAREQANKAAAEERGKERECNQFLELQEGWTHYGAGYRPASFRLRGGLCVLSGLVRCTPASPPHIATLPENCRPVDGRLVFSVNAHTEVNRVDVLADGRVVWVAGSRQLGWLSLSGIVFTVPGEICNVVDPDPGGDQEQSAKEAETKDQQEQSAKEAEAKDQQEQSAKEIEAKKQQEQSAKEAAKKDQQEQLAKESSHKQNAETQAKAEQSAKEQAAKG